ncbi:MULTISPECIES: lipopolysaccharide assembly LapA domain-containing protein [unclassified Halanaerobium]|uniref:LapA family protein n=1 Tax=unclassified Halanaerobium TaxID=2641197 RepID=UPI000DF323EB|nr:MULTISPECIES: LapA family protein [unclassified Halanaerobium]RCW43786.1 putative integral membrane protein [Halanaerobium sp. MA284_MarDTE_T2]RCW80210.1 putative integral membrane protein [Halanaerobium sp. DL-01]
MQRNLIIALVFALLIAIFAMQNAVSVTLSFFNYSFQTSLVVVVLGSMAVGALIMGLFSSLKQIKLKREIRQLQKKYSELKAQFSYLEDQKTSNIVEKNSLSKNNEDDDNIN